jgi:chaperone required for assembly of F1-ATPase
VKAWALTLDERGVRTPSNKEMLLPSMTMARTIALEFDVQDLHILPYTMPLVRPRPRAPSRSLHPAARPICET